MSTKVNLKEILSNDCAPERRYVPDLSDVKELVHQARFAGYTIGIVGGVWDLLHIGHAKYLMLAKKECDILITIVDSDALVKNRKGPTRPVVPEDERVQMVCHMSTSDIVTLRTLEGHLSDKEYISSALLPDVCILSTSTGDIPPEQREVMSQFIKRIKIFEPQAETSTSARIRLLAIDSSKPLAEAVSGVVERRVTQIGEILHAMGGDIEQVTKQHLDSTER